MFAYRNIRLLDRNFQMKRKKRKESDVAAKQKRIHVNEIRILNNTLWKTEIDLKISQIVANRQVIDYN